ncbi:12711_t:CDS:2, partial [Funneliformis geosporum]
LATLKNLDDKMDLIRSELGNVYESSARLEIAKINGSHYSSKFEVYDLNGLARLSLPRKQFPNENPNLNTLADRAEKALNGWEAHERKSTSSENRLYLANTKFLGVMLITSYIMDPKIAIENNHAPFDEVLELDIRGRPTSYLDMKNVSIEIGEIKLTTKNLLHGYRQLLIRLAILGFAIEALNSKGDEVVDYRCDLVGILYVPKVPSVINIPSE